MAVPLCWCSTISTLSPKKPRSFCTDSRHSPSRPPTRAFTRWFLYALTVSHRPYWKESCCRSLEVDIIANAATAESASSRGPIDGGYRVGDLTDEEAITSLTKQRNLDQETARKILEFYGTRIHLLKVVCSHIVRQNLNGLSTVFVSC